MKVDPGQLTRTILVAVLANSVLGASRLAVPMIALAAGASDVTVGAMAALLMVVPVLTTLPFGRWMDRVGALWPMKLSIVLAILSGAVGALAPGLPALFATSLLAGAGAVFSHVASVKAVGSVGDSDTRVRTLGVLALAYSIMQFMAPLLVGFAYDHAGARGAFATMSVMPLLGFVLLISGPHHYASASGEHPARAAETDDRRPLLASARLREWVGVYAVFQAALTLYPVVVALHGSRLGMSASALSGLVAAQALGAGASRAAISLLRGALSQRLLVGGALVVSGCAYGIVPLLHAWAPLAVVSVLLGAAAGLGQPVAMSMVYESAPPGRVNEAISMASIAANTLQLITPFVSGLLASIYGVGVMTSMIAVSLACAALLGTRKGKN